MHQSRKPRSDTLYHSLLRAILFAGGVVLFLWFLQQALLAILFITVAFILALALNPPVAWLEKQGLGRVWATLLVMLILLGITIGIGALVVPLLIEQTASLVTDVPAYADRLNHRALRWLEHYPQAQQAVNRAFSSDRELMQHITPLAQNLLARVGGYASSVVGVVVFALFLLTTVVYALAQPRALLHSYIHVFPPNLRDQAERAFTKSADAVAGWLWSNVIIGALEAVLAGIGLWLLGVPGAPVWAALTFFSELVPQFGAYLMMGPPVLVALAINPLTALWVALFYFVMMTLVSNILAPVVRSSQMKLHPVSLLFSIVAMSSVFGILGALIATPVTGIFKAYYDEFFASRRPEDPDGNTRVNRMLQGSHRKAHEKP